MIARHWHGRVPATLAADYLKLMEEVAPARLPVGAGQCLAPCACTGRRATIVHVEMLTLWEDEAAIRRFAGEDMTLAKYYDFDPDFLLELETTVRHYRGDRGLSDGRPGPARLRSSTSSRRRSRR